MAHFLDALNSGRVLLMDGAMGTELQRAGLGEGECCELWNLTHPNRVQAIHRAYADAGAQVLLTNTFQANRVALDRFGQAKQLSSLLRAAVDLAYHLPFGQLVLLSVGPIVSASSGLEFDELRRLRDLQTLDPLLDGILLETCSTPRVRWAINRLTLFPGRWPVLLSLTYLRSPRRGLTTKSGHPPEWYAARARKWGAAALGVNCGRDIDMEDVIEIVRRYRQATDLPLFARPNAGTPVKVADDWVYPHTPAAMASRLPELLEAGVAMVGGCCGTTPEHIAAFRPIVEQWNRRQTARGSLSRRPSAPKETGPD